LGGGVDGVDGEAKAVDFCRQDGGDEVPRSGECDRESKEVGRGGITNSGIADVLVNDALIITAAVCGQTSMEAAEGRRGVLKYKPSISNS
jgi:hypothetical protein